MVGNRSLFSKKMFHNRVIMMLMRFHEIFLNKKKITCDVMALWFRTMQFHEMFIFFFDYQKTKITFGLCWSGNFECLLWFFVVARTSHCWLVAFSIARPEYKSIWRRFHEFSSFFQSHFFRNSAGEFFVRYHYQRVSKINKYITSKAEAAKRRARAFIPWSFDSIFF